MSSLEPGSPSMIVVDPMSVNGIDSRSLLSPLVAGLPSLANRFVIVGKGQRIDMVFSRFDFLALCEHMQNENSLDHFLSAWIDAKSGEARFAKAKYARADKRAGWAWDAITGRAKIATSIGFYPSNERKTTRWGAIDFDAHDGCHERARQWAFTAFGLLLKHPQLYLVLCSSGGGGFHVFLFTREFYPVGDWTVLLKQVCQLIGAEIAPGVCEIFPNDKAESQRVGKGIRAPGTLNPKTGNPSLIEAETVRPLLQLLPRNWTVGLGKDGIGKVPHVRPLAYGKLSLHKRTNTYSPSTDGLVAAIIQKHPILRVGSRNDVLMQLIGDISHKFGLEKAREIVEQHYQTYAEYIRTSLPEHIVQFLGAWQTQVEAIRNRFTPEEQRTFEKLRTDHQREGFRIVWAFAGTATRKGEPTFPIVRNSLADRLTVTPPGASDVIRALVREGAIKQTEVYRRHVRSAHYQWSCRGDSVNER